MTNVKAGIYARISLDVAGEALGVARQTEDCKAKAAALGWNVAEVYTDNDVSASGKVPRPAYERMLADLTAGTISAVVVYDLDRLTRKPAELEAFIDLTDRHGIALANVAGDVDLTTAAGRMVARIKGAVARQEAERIGERVKRQKQQRLASGMPAGSRYRTFGYARDWSLNEPEAAIVRDVFSRVVAGESVNAITNSLKASGLRTVSDKPWSFQATSRILESAIYAGFVTHKGSVVGRSAVPAIVDEATYQLTQDRASRPAWNARKHLLSGIATCDVCKTPMNGAGKQYVCSRMQGGCGNVRIQTKWLDDVVNAYMGNAVMFDKFRGVEPEPGTDETDPVADIDKAIEQARAANLTDDLSLEDLLPMLKELRSQRAIAVRAAAKAVEQKAFWQPVADYDTADLSLKRTEIRKWITAIMVKPAVRGRNTFDENRCYVLVSETHPALQYNGGNRLAPLAVINVMDYREHVPEYPFTLPIEERVDARNRAYVRPQQG